MARTQTESARDRIEDQRAFANWMPMSVATLLGTLSASCCMLPVGLTVIGLGGSWLAVLGPFVEFRAFLLSGVGVLVAWSWAHLWCATCGLAGNRSGLALTLLATAVFLAALSAPLWENGAARAMWAILSNNR